MCDFKRLKELGEQYDHASKKRDERFRLWNNEGVSEFVEKVLKKVATEMKNCSSFFSDNLYVGTLYPTIEENGERLLCKERKDIFIKAGKTLVASYCSEKNTSFRTSLEGGFEIHFVPILNGKIHAYAIEHSIDNQKDKYHTIAVIDSLASLSEETIVELTTQGIEKVINSSFLFSF